MEQNLHPNLKAQLAMVRRDLKSQSKNDVVRAVLGLLVEVAKKDTDLKRALGTIKRLEDEAKIAEGFLKGNEEAFQAYIESLPKEETTPADTTPVAPPTTEGSASGAA